MTTTARFRDTVRVSGYLAIAAVGLFAIVGTVLVVGSVRGGPTVWLEPYAPGEEIRTPIGRDIALWGSGEGLQPEQVTCSGERYGALPPGPPRGSEDLAVIEHPRIGSLVYLAQDDRRGDRDVRIACDGPDLQAVHVGPAPRTDLGRNVGLGFFGGAAVAGLWAVATLAVTRRKLSETAGDARPHAD